MSFKVFISYSTKDLSRVEQVRRILDDTSMNVFFAEHSVMPGESLKTKIISAIKSCDVFLLLCSKSSKESEWVQQEVGIATAEGKAIIPIFLEPDLQLPGFLNKDIKYLSAHDDPEKAWALLKRNVFERAQKKHKTEGLVWLALGVAILFLLGRD